MSSYVRSASRLLTALQEHAIHVDAEQGCQRKRRSIWPG